MNTTDTTGRMGGLWLPLITPFNQGELDEGSLCRMVDHYSRKGITGFILAATTGESLSLEDREVKRLIDVVQEANLFRLPVYLGHTGSNTKKLAEKIRQTNAWHVDGYLIAAPYYVRPSQEGLFQHFRIAAEASDRPIIVYNIPYRTGVNILNDTMLRLAELPAIKGVKDCCAIPEQSLDLIRRRPAGLSVLVGDDATFLANVAAGADGGILATAHVLSDFYQKMLQLLRQGDRAGAEAEWSRHSGTIPMLFAEPNPGPVKYWLWRQGLIASPELRLPMTGITPELQKRIDVAIAAFGASGAGSGKLSSAA